MGAKQSIYEKPGTLNYYRFSAQEYALVKKTWSGIEVNPVSHGNAYLRSFCSTYPQYVKFFTTELKVNPINSGTLSMLKFSVIMETIGYLLLDFNKKPKQLDRLVGYIAMMHKDMQLNEEDLNNFVSALLEYLLRTYPAQMTTQCQEAMSKFMMRVVHELVTKMRIFRDYDDALSVDVSTRLPWERCPFFAEPLIFGQTKSYWKQRKSQWDARLDEWMQITLLNASAPVEETKTRSDSLADETEKDLLQTKPSPREITDDDDDPVSRKRETSYVRRPSAERYRSVSALPSFVHTPQRQLEAARNPRERYRLRGVLYLTDLNETDRERDDTETTEQFDESAENDAAISRRTARERRRRKLQRQSEMKK